VTHAEAPRARKANIARSCALAADARTGSFAANRRGALPNCSGRFFFC
jgi:hypothetical protein